MNMMLYKPKEKTLTLSDGTVLPFFCGEELGEVGFALAQVINGNINIQDAHTLLMVELNKVAKESISLYKQVPTPQALLANATFDELRGRVKGDTTKGWTSAEDEWAKANKKKAIAAAGEQRRSYWNVRDESIAEHKDTCLCEACKRAETRINELKDEWPPGYRDSEPCRKPHLEYGILEIDVTEEVKEDKWFAGKKC